MDTKKALRFLTLTVMVPVRCRILHGNQSLGLGLQDGQYLPVKEPLRVLWLPVGGEKVCFAGGAQFKHSQHHAMTSMGLSS